MMKQEDKALGNSYLLINNKLIDEFNDNLSKLSEKEIKARKAEMHANFQKALPCFFKGRGDQSGSFRCLVLPWHGICAIGRDQKG